jgi:hypothetical protein
VLLTVRRQAVPDPLLRAQRQLEAWLARRGVARQAQEGPRDYLARAAQALPQRAGQLQALAARYLFLRYGKTVVSAREAQAYRGMVREFLRRGVVK